MHYAKECEVNVYISRRDSSYYDSFEHLAAANSISQEWFLVSVYYDTDWRMWSFHMLHAYCIGQSAMA